jgi:ATP-dependent Lhr-like helicase
MEQYRAAWLDALLNSTSLRWIGAGRQKVLFALEDEAGLFVAPAERDLARARSLFPHDRGAYPLFEIARHAGVNTEEAARQLWDLAWKSVCVNDAIETLRKGILTNFTAIGQDGEGRPGGERHSLRRSAMNRWAASRPLQGNWRINSLAPGEAEGIEKMERDKERARILLDRYGILFRELLDNEPPPLRWRRIFPALRLMELSGEITSGYFFTGVPGVQFMSFVAFRFLQEGLDEELIFWLNAKDPASLCGIGLAALPEGLPRRLSAHHTVFHGRRLILVSRRNGRDLQFHIPPDHPRLPESLTLFKVLLARDFNPQKRILVERINGATARESTYRDALRAFGFADVYEGLELRRRY